MIWQDLVFTLTTLLSILASWQMVVLPEKPPKRVSLAKAACSLIVAGTSVTLGLYIAAGTTFLLGILWFIVFIQNIRKGKGKSA